MNKFDVAAVAVGKALARRFNIPPYTVNYNKKMNTPPLKGFGFSDVGLTHFVNEDVSDNTFILIGKRISMSLIEANKYVSMDAHDLVVFVKNKL